MLRVEAKDVIVVTGKSPAGQPVLIARVQGALDQLARDGEIAINVDTVRYRSAFVGAVLATLPCARMSLRPAMVRLTCRDR